MRILFGRQVQGLVGTASITATQDEFNQGTYGAQGIECFVCDTVIDIASMADDAGLWLGALDVEGGPAIAMWSHEGCGPLTVYESTEEFEQATGRTSQAPEPKVGTDVMMVDNGMVVRVES